MCGNWPVIKLGEIGGNSVPCYYGVIDFYETLYLRNSKSSLAQKPNHVSRWHGNIPRPSELYCPYHNVHILRPVCTGTCLSEVPLVEEAPNVHTASRCCF